MMQKSYRAQAYHVNTLWIKWPTEAGRIRKHIVWTTKVQVRGKQTGYLLHAACWCLLVPWTVRWDTWGKVPADGTWFAGPATSSRAAAIHTCCIPHATASAYSHYVFCASLSSTVLLLSYLISRSQN